jgi:hypothetical protein
MMKNMMKMTNNDIKLMKECCEKQIFVLDSLLSQDLTDFERNMLKEYKKGFKNTIKFLKEALHDTN